MTFWNTDFDPMEMLLDHENRLAGVRSDLHQLALAHNNQQTMVNEMIQQHGHLTAIIKAQKNQIAMLNIEVARLKENSAN
jgi:hypothetical protein